MTPEVANDDPRLTLVAQRAAARLAEVARTYRHAIPDEPAVLTAHKAVALERVRRRCGQRFARRGSAGLPATSEQPHADPIGSVWSARGERLDACCAILMTDSTIH